MSKYTTDAFYQVKELHGYEKRIPFEAPADYQENPGGAHDALMNAAKHFHAVSKGREVQWPLTFRIFDTQAVAPPIIYGVVAAQTTTTFSVETDAL